MRTLSLALALALPALAAAQVPEKLGYQGRLLKADGSPETGIQKLTFSLFANETGAPGETPLWTEEQSVPLSDGYYATFLGEVKPLGNAFDGSDRFLELAVSGSPLSPRQRVSSVPYALVCTDARNLKGGTVNASSISVAGGGSISIGGTSVFDSSGQLAAGAISSVPLPWANVTGVGSTTSWPGTVPWTSVTGVPTSDSANVKDFGARGDGVTDDTNAIQAALTSLGGHGKLVFAPGAKYRCGQVNVPPGFDGLHLDLNGSTILAISTFTFVFGTSSDSPTSRGLLVENGTFDQAPSTDFGRYIAALGTRDAIIRNCLFRRPGNGAVYVSVGSEDITVEECRFEGTTLGLSRAVWFDGSAASDFASQLLDTTTLLRNGVPLPTHATRHGLVRDNIIVGAQYGVYLMNAREVTVEGNAIDISGSGGRCVAINAYSPGARVIDNRCRSDRAATGVLITQASNDVVLRGNVFEGDFGGGHAIHVQYGAEAIIADNDFNADGSTMIEVNTGGSMVVERCSFNRPSGLAPGERDILVTTLDAASLSEGASASVLPGSIIRSNTFRHRGNAVLFLQRTSTSGNSAGIAESVVRDNIFMNRDKFNFSQGQAPVAVSNPNRAKPMSFSMRNNVVTPTGGTLNQTVAAGDVSPSMMSADVHVATFFVSVSPGTPPVVSQLGGTPMGLAVSRSAHDLVLSPRTSPTPGGAVARVLAFTPASANLASLRVADWSNANLLVTAVGASGTNLSGALDSFSFYVTQIQERGD